jgi:two-component system chemotaxis response regulator CheB
MFTRFLAERLSVKGPLKALEAEDGMPVEPGRIYVTPGDFHLEVTRYKGELLINLSQAPHENSCRPSADFMFRSLASIYGPRLLGIVMTGMGQDGRKGAEHIRSMGGTVVAQDEASSLVWGMPRAVVTANLHHAVVPLSEISRVINEACSGDRKERK